MGFLAIILVAWFGYAGYLTYKSRVDGAVKVSDFVKNLKWPVDVFNALKAKYLTKK
jgi:hypothetical protein